MISCLLASQAIAENIEDYRLYRSPHYLGRGDTGIANADNQEAIFYNPAGLAQGKGIYKKTIFASPHIELSSDTKDLVRKVASEDNTSPSALREHVGVNQHVGASNFSGVVFRRAALGGVVNTNNNFLLAKSPENSGIEVLDANSTTNIMGTFSIAEGFFNQFFLVGTTIKYLQQTHAQASLNVIDSSAASDALDDGSNQNSYSGIGADLGMMLIWQGKNPFSLGLTIENVGGLDLANDISGGASRKIPQLVNAGLAIDTGTKLSRLKFMLDFRDLTSEVEDNMLLKTHFGMEMTIGSFMGLTAGLNQGYPGFGAYVDLYAFRFDIGTYTQEMGTFAGSRGDNRIYLRLSAGI